MIIDPIRKVAALLVFLVLVVPGRSAEEPADDRVYDRAIRAAAWVMLPKSSASACLIDADAHLLLTNYHVVQDADEVQVIYPLYRRGRLIDDHDFYWRNWKQFATDGRVIHRDKTHDLALIQVDHLPASARALEFAAKAVEPGETVCRVGSPSAKDEGWQLTKGVVKKVATHSLRYKSGQYVLCRWVENDAPPIHGHSGSAVLNADGELVGVHAAGEDATNLSAAVEESVVKKFLEEGREKLAVAEAK